MLDRQDKSIAGNNITERVDDLLDSLRPRISEHHVQILTDLIRDAQKAPIQDKKEFVQSVNESLELMNLRIRLPDGNLARLRVMPGASGAGFIQFELIGKGTCGGFATTPIELVPYADRRRARDLEKTPASASSVIDRAEELLGRISPRIEEQHKNALIDLIHDARKDEIADKQRFVHVINEILDVMHLRIQLEDGELARLRVVPGALKRGYIQFGFIGGGGRGGFATAEIKLAEHKDERRR